MLKIGFIGAGNMGGALAKAAAKNNSFEILVSDNDNQKALALCEEIGASISDNNEISNKAEYIYLGVKPQVLPAVLSEIAPALKERNDHFVLVTMAAGIKTETVCKILGFNCAVIRIMPNTPVMIGEGLILYCGNSLVTETDYANFLSLCENAGLTDKLDEELIDAGCSVSGCGPAFVYMFIDALAKGGINAGLPTEKALFYAAQTAKGAAEMVKQTDKAPEELKRNVCSPNGSTIEGVNHLENSGFTETVLGAVNASFNRTVELGKQ